MSNLSSSELMSLYLEYVRYRDSLLWPERPVSVEVFFSKHFGRDRLVDVVNE